MSLAAIVTVPLPVVCVAGMVRVVFPPSEKSAATAGSTGAAEISIVVSSLEGWSSVAVTVLEPPFSEIAAGDRVSITVGVASSSSIVTVTVPFARPLALPLSATVSFGSSISSFIGIRVNVPVWLVPFAGIVIVKLLTGA